MAAAASFAVAVAAMAANPSAAFHVSHTPLLSSSLKSIHPRPHGLIRYHGAGPRQRIPSLRQPAISNQGVRGLQSSEKGSGVKILVVLLGVGFVFGGLPPSFPLINNGFNYAKSDPSISGAATGLRQSEIDEKLKRVPAFAVTDDQVGCSSAQYQGKNRGYFFLNPKDAEKFRDRVKVRGFSRRVSTERRVRSCRHKEALFLFEQQRWMRRSSTSSRKRVSLSVGRPRCQDVTGPVDKDPFEILPYGDEIERARSIKNPENCDICWGAEGVKEKIPVYLVEGCQPRRLLPAPQRRGRSRPSEGWKSHYSALLRQGDRLLLVVMATEREQAGADALYKQASKTGEPKLQVCFSSPPAIRATLNGVQVLDLSALIKKMRKGGSTEYTCCDIPVCCVTSASGSGRWSSFRTRMPWNMPPASLLRL
eukprot:758760-Hanusia_phi.AAC.9